MYEPLDFDKISQDFLNIFDYDLKPMINLVGEEIDTIVNMQIFKDTNLFSSICEAMSNSEYSAYLSFNELAVGSNIKNQFACLAEGVNELKNSNIVPLIKNINNENQNDSINAIISELGVVGANGKVLSTRILGPVLTCSILKNTFIYGLNEAHNALEYSLNSLVSGEDITLAPFNTSGLISETDNNQIISLVEKLVAYAKDIRVEKLQGNELLDTIMDSNLTALGLALDEAKNANLFATTKSGCLYNDMMVTLSKSDFNTVIDFTVALESDFSWKTELTSLQLIKLNKFKNTTTNL